MIGVAEVEDNPQLEDALNTVVSSSAEEFDTSSEAETSDEDDIPYYEQAVVDIRKGDRYQCMICTVEMDYTCNMYACPHCYRVFDYECIREWALKSTHKSPDNVWKCPNCYHPSKQVPAKNKYTCWCGKNMHPEPNPLEPNSCGQTCDAPTCVHGCSKTCHLGPHPQCMRIIKIKCLCGRHSREVLCFESKKEQKFFQCGEPCGLTLPCCVHKCKRKCHKGPCGKCPEVLNGSIKCYCGEQRKDKILCKDVVIQGRSVNKKGEKWIGAFACSKIRSVTYSCGNHAFTEDCKAPPSLPKRVQCPFAPKMLKTCPCGKSPLKALDKVRTRCTDPIPTCDSICGKRLQCGKHECPFTCHTGPCMDPCLVSDKVQCSCHARSFMVPCQFETEPHCNTKCESLMSCRRHRCVERCCSGRSLAQRREKTIFLARDRLDESLVEAEHICLKQCNLKLACGRHYCQNKCHPGSCPPCLESDSNDLVCPCGRTVVPAPVRCGTKLPSCPYPCVKTLQGPLDCGHPPMPHKCHSSEVQCPSCTAPVFKTCNCGKNEKVRTVCFQKNVSCGKICKLPLKFCHHGCQRACHEVGKCQTTCNQKCALQRSNCSHTCQWKCHGSNHCPDTPCKIRVLLKCECGRLESYAQCGATNEKSSIELSQLPCNEECEVLKRHRTLMEAFGIRDESSKLRQINEIQNLAEKVATFEELLLPFTEATLSIYARQTTWCSQIASFLDRLMDENNRQSLHFKPMRAPQRNFIHEIAKAYNLYSESQDMEPKRSVFVKKNVDSRRPLISLEEALPLYQSFKQFQKEKKAQDLEKSKTHRILNVTVEESQMKPAKATYNGLIIRGILDGVTEDDIKDCFGQYLKYTLLSNPVYSTLSSSELIIYPHDYHSVTVNVENDLRQLVGHFDHIVRDKFIGESVAVCQVEKYLEGMNSDGKEEYSHKRDVSSLQLSEVKADTKGTLKDADADAS